MRSVRPSFQRSSKPKWRRIPDSLASRAAVNDAELRAQLPAPKSKPVREQLETPDKKARIYDCPN